MFEPPLESNERKEARTNGDIVIYHAIYCSKSVLYSQEKNIRFILDKCYSLHYIYIVGVENHHRTREKGVQNGL